MAKTLTLKNRPEALHARLAASAKRHRSCLNNEAIVCLEAGLGATPPPVEQCSPALIVLDTNTNVVVYLLLQEPEWAAPPLWRSEWRNVVSHYLRRDLLPFTAALALTQQAEALLSAHVQPVASEQVLQLVARSGCSAHHCEFVAAAQQLGVPLVMADRALLEAFPGVARALDQRGG